MRILFVNPSLRRGFHSKFLPVGLAYVMTVAKQGGYDFDLFDIDKDDVADDQIEDFISKNQYDVILFGCIVTHYKWSKWFVNTIKKYHPQTKVIVGNSVAGSMPSVFMKNIPADIGIIGEGEFTTLDVLNHLRDKKDLTDVKGIVYRTADGGFIENPRRIATNVADLPMVNWDFFDVEHYFKKSGNDFALGIDTPPGFEWRTMPISTARGCIAKCTFCHYVFWEDGFRWRPAEKIMAEIERNIDTYGANYLNFWDDLSFSAIRQAETLVDLILASKKPFYWNASVRTDLFGNEQIPYNRRLAVAQKFRDAGCINLGYSLESADADILKMMNKKTKPEYFREQVKLLRKVGINSGISVVFGYPIETKETIRKTFDMCLELGIYPSIGFLLPLPYTGMYKYALEHGFIKDENTYLEDITERQDYYVNMTQMETSEILDEIKEGCARLNQELGLNLAEDKYIKTGGYRQHNKLLKADPNNLKRIKNDVSFNYSRQTYYGDTPKDVGVKPNVFSADNC